MTKERRQNDAREEAEWQQIGGRRGRRTIETNKTIGSDKNDNGEDEKGQWMSVLLYTWYWWKDDEEEERQ